MTQDNYTVYVIADSSGLCKVGMTNDMDRRSTEYRTHNPNFRFVATESGLTHDAAASIERYVLDILRPLLKQNDWHEVDQHRCTALVRSAVANHRGLQEEIAFDMIIQMTCLVQPILQRHWDRSKPFEDQGHYFKGLMREPAIQWITDFWRTVNEQRKSATND